MGSAANAVAVHALLSIAVPARCIALDAMLCSTRAWQPFVHLSRYMVTALLICKLLLLLLPARWSNCL